MTSHFLGAGEEFLRHFQALPGGDLHLEPEEIGLEARAPVVEEGKARLVLARRATMIAAQYLSVMPSQPSVTAAGVVNDRSSSMEL